MGTEVEGFDQVGEVMLNYYRDLLGQTPQYRQSIDASIISHGEILSQEQQIDILSLFQIWT